MFDKTNKKKYRYITTFITVLILINAFKMYGQSKTFDLFAVSDLVKVFEDGHNCPRPKRAIDVFGIRNEHISAQCVIKANTDLHNVSVKVSDLVCENSSDLILKDEVSWNYVGSVPVPVNSDRTKKEYVVRIAPARFPDYLSEEKEISVSRGEYKPVWLTIKIPKYAVAGKYTGKVTIISDRGENSIPIFLTVYPPAIPDERHMKVAFWNSTRDFKKFHNINEQYSEEFYNMLKVYAKNMAEHRQNVFRIPFNSIIITRDRSGKYSLDFSRFDRWAEIFWDIGKMDFIETGFLATFGEPVEGARWRSTEIVLQDHQVFDESSGKKITVSGKECIPEILPLFENHIKEKGWLDKTLFHIADEPSAHNIIKWREVSDFIHSCAPSLKRMDAIETTDFFDRLEVWVPKLNELFSWYETYKRAQSEGYELWYYMAMSTNAFPNRFIDLPLIETRILRWLNYRFGLSGYLHYGFNSWTEDPYTIMNRDLYGIGGHYIVYPKKDGLINSIRWEQVRNGIQDYEYLWLLEDKLEKIKNEVGSSASWLDPTQRGREIASKVIQKMNKFTRDPDVLYSAKKQIIDEILSLDTSPRLIVQTNPMEGSELIYGPATYEFYGLTEPGTELTINTYGLPEPNDEKSLRNVKLPVSEEGVFMDIMKGTHENNKLVIIAKNKNGTKKVIRTFRVLY